MDEARDAGAAPVLLTLLERRRWTDHGRWTQETLTEYADAIRAAVASKGVP